jgi:hypothetical protein
MVQGSGSDAALQTDSSPIGRILSLDEASNATQIQCQVSVSFPA